MKEPYENEYSFLELMEARSGMLKLPKTLKFTAIGLDVSSQSITLATNSKANKLNNLQTNSNVYCAQMYKSVRSVSLKISMTTMTVS